MVGSIWVMKYMKHYYEKFNMFKNILDLEDPIIVEVGAHYGEDSLRFTEAFENPTVYCFEPDPRNIEIFKKHVVNSKVRLFEVALSDNNGEAEFFQSYDEKGSEAVPSKYDWINLDDYKNNKLSNSGSSSLRRGYGKTLPESIKVKTERFDTWFENNNISNVDLVWMDVQGAERSVLEGMGEKIKNIRFIWVEYGELGYEGAMSRQETVKYMTNKSFSVLEEYSDKSQSGDLMFCNLDLK